jgi:hypothetical protein
MSVNTIVLKFKIGLTGSIINPFLMIKVVITCSIYKISCSCILACKFLFYFKSARNNYSLNRQLISILVLFP